ncbi:MAG: hypothetical protein H0U70_13355 [Tatlockia sp.]|nr:hypothetical protein [Tatlockia sp.]
MSQIGQEIIKTLEQVQLRIDDMNALVSSDFFGFLQIRIHNLKNKAINHNEQDLIQAAELESELKNIEDQTLQACINILRGESTSFEKTYFFDASEARPAMQRLETLLQSFKNEITERNLLFKQQLINLQQDLEKKNEGDSHKTRLDNINSMIKKIETSLSSSLVTQAEIERLTFEPKKRRIKKSSPQNLRTSNHNSPRNSDTWESYSDESSEASSSSLSPDKIAQNSLNFKVINCITPKTNLATIATSLYKEKELAVKNLRLKISSERQLFLQAHKNISNIIIKPVELIDHCKEDLLIIQNRKLFIIYDSQASQLVAEVTISLNRLDSIPNPNAEVEQLFSDELSRAIEKLNNLITLKIELKNSIIARQEELLPDSDGILDLKFLQNNRKEALQKSLSTALESICEIHPQANDQKILDATNQLINFIDEIFNKLVEQDLPIKKEKIRLLYNKLLNHLGFKEQWLSRTAIDAIPLTKEELKSLIADIFAEIHFGDDKIKLKKSSIYLLSLKFYIDAFPITNLKQIIAEQSENIAETIKINLEKEKNLNDLEQLNSKQRENLINKKIELTNNLAQKKQELDNLIILFADKHQQNDCVLSSRLCVNELTKLTTELNLIDSTHNEKIKVLNLISSPMDRLNQLNLEQEEMLKSLKILEKQLNELIPTFNNCKKTLSEAYNLEVGQLFSSVEKALSEAEALLTVAYSKNIMADYLDPDKERLLKIKQPHLKPLLFNLEESIKPILNRIQIYVTKAKETLINNKNSEFKKIEQTVNLLVLPELTPGNPFITCSSLCKLRVESNLVEAKLALDRLNNCHSNHLETTIDSYNETLSAVNKEMHAFNQDYLPKAEYMEGRLGSEAYKTSVRVLEALKKEYNRILDKKILKLNSKKQKLNLEALKQLFDSNHLHTKELTRMKALDSRLFKIWAIKYEFESININYINENLEFNTLLCQSKIKQMKSKFLNLYEASVSKLLDDNPANKALIELDNKLKSHSNFLFNDFTVIENYENLLELIHPNLYELSLKIRNEKPAVDCCTKKCYLTALLNCVETHLHNDNMEHFSESKRNSFEQFLRLHLLKPLQALRHWVGSFFNKENSKHQFFITGYATKTEAALVNVGNEAAEILITAAAVG